MVVRPLLEHEDELTGTWITAQLSHQILGISRYVLPLPEEKAFEYARTSIVVQHLL